MLKIQKKNNVVIGQGAEKLMYFKGIVFVIMVSSVFFYTYLVSKFRQEELFYGILSVFLGLFILYSFVLLPNLKRWEPGYAKRWLAEHPSKKLSFTYTCMSLWRNWMNMVFFCIAELWGQYCIIIIFWGVANELFSREEAKKTYHYFIASGCLGGIIGTLTLGWFALNAVEKQGPEQQSYLCKMVSITGILTTLVLLLTYHWVKRSFFNQSQVKTKKEAKSKLSFTEGLRFMFNNPYLRAAFFMVIGCAICSNVAQIAYENYVRRSGVGGTRTPCEYTFFKVKENLMTNTICIVACLFISGRVVQKFGWQTLATVAPVVMVVMGTVFFVCSMLYHNERTRWIYHALGMDGMTVICSVGMLQSSLMVAAKYVFFDSSKAMMYTGLDVETRKKGRGFINVIGSRAGKSFANLLQIIALPLLSVQQDVRDIVWLLCVVLWCFGAGWMVSVRYIGKTIKNKTKSDQDVSGN